MAYGTVFRSIPLEYQKLAYLHLTGPVTPAVLHGDVCGSDGEVNRRSENFHLMTNEIFVNTKNITYLLFTDLISKNNIELMKSQ